MKKKLNLKALKTDESGPDEHLENNQLMRKASFASNASFTSSHRARSSEKLKRSVESMGSSVKSAKLGDSGVYI